MFSTLDVDLRPGQGLGPFDLGSSLWNVVDVLRRHQHSFPQVDVRFDPDVSNTTPVVLHIRPHLDLLFSGQHQRLHTISVRRLRDTSPPLTIRYKGTVLSSAEEPLRRVNVSRTFGPTYPKEDENLQYPGVCFCFEEEAREGGLKGKTVAPADDKTQDVKRILIGQKGRDLDERDALDEVVECESMNGEISRATVKIHDGVTFDFYPTSSKPLHVRLGITTAQDLMLDLGAPSRLHYKEDDRITIHGSSESTDNSSDYFYNYFQHGVDFLISGRNHVVKKIVLHTNIPGSPLFQKHKRCPWEILGEPEDNEDDSPPRIRFTDRFERISHFLQPGETPPSMLLNRTDDEDNLILPNSTTRLHGYDGIILEVTELSQVVTVMLF